MKRSGSAFDPLWYKDAVIYELHVRAFADSNSDGIGDFPGLLGKLDYLQDLGVTCLWLLPFFPSPLKDDGYDVSDYMTVHPNYGTLDDFKAFLDAAHDRGLQVMVELVINHTSDQHPWFQRARNALPGSPERDFYVWSDTVHKYEDARIIFTDTEKSNWTWDPVANAYFWHRFFSHQPDLNYDNPLVVEEVLQVMRHWLDMGVDGLRIDAIPYLVERDGTSCENLPETHEIIRTIRKTIDSEYDNRMVLAEANQWPTDVRPYFGDGDECQMAFHFPLMPRIYMALRQEDRLPITDIMAQTPDIPESCQWGIFLRNHDELTLEMVTDEERDYMYLAYSADPRMRINIGIRRRLAPLLDNNRRRIELLNSLLFSLPGTPILYYGDEIGMGDNIYLGDRNGVRTPMQWSADRNAGFSRANPARLFSPVIMDPVWGYEAINVEAQLSDQSSLLNWMRNMIALRKLFRVFGRGKLTFLGPANRKVLAYIREDENERVLCVANLSRFAQPVQLDLTGYEGMVPVEMLGYVEFPSITRQPYPLTLGPYGFLWLELQPGRDQPPISSDGLDDMSIYVANSGDWEQVLDGLGAAKLAEKILPEYLPRQRWFGSKSRQINLVEIEDWGRFEDGRSAFALVRVGFTAGAADNYLMVLTMALGHEAAQLRETSPGAVLVALGSAAGSGVLYDATYSGSANDAMLHLIESGDALSSKLGAIQGKPSSMFAQLRGQDRPPLPSHRSTAEQSNTSVIFGERLIMKLFRKQQPGPNPDTEIGSFLTESTSFRHIAPFGGSIEYARKDFEPWTFAMLQGLVTNEGDGWQWTLEELDRYYETCASREFPREYVPVTSLNVEEIDRSQAPERAKEYAGTYLKAACVLGERTGEMHLALATPTGNPAFDPITMRPAELTMLRNTWISNAAKAFDTLKDSLPHLPDNVVELAGLVLSRRGKVMDRFRQLTGEEANTLLTRIHGDYHLGQVLRVKGDFVILDFEGEPARSLAERRAKQSPLKDVAGMLRSFSYAAFAVLTRYTTRRPEDFAQLEPWAKLWETAMITEFLKAYRSATANSPICPSDPGKFEKLLEIFVLDKALYELSYELNNRPAWAHIPLAGILSLPL